MTHLPAKPIFVVLVNKNLSRNYIEGAHSVIEKTCPDYNVLIVNSLTGDNDVEFKAFYPKDFDEIELEELKKQIQEKLISDEQH